MNKSENEMQEPLKCKNKKQIDNRPWIDMRDMVVFLSIICGALITYIAIQNDFISWENYPQLIVGGLLSIAIWSLIIGFLALKTVYVFNKKEKSLPKTSNHTAETK